MAKKKKSGVVVAALAVPLALYIVSHVNLLGLYVLKSQKIEGVQWHFLHISRDFFKT